MKSFSATDAKNNFGAVLDALSFGPVKVVKNGKAAAYMLSAKEYEAMQVDYAMTRVKAAVLAKGPAVMKTLTDYSNGRIGKDAAIKALGIQFQGQLLDLLGIAALPLPTLPADEIDNMVNDALSLFEHG